MRKRMFIGMALIGMMSLGTHAMALNFDTDDSVLVEQINASVHSYRIVVADFQRLQTALKQSSGSEEVSSLPAVREYIQTSMDPADRSLRDLLKRYEREYGENALRKLAKKRGFTDLLTNN